MKIIFMGTPDFSVGTLEALVEAGHEVVLAVTQPDKPKGRGKEMQFTPVKECALAHNIPVYQPTKLREPECIEELKKYQADVCVVVAFGQILPKEILEMTPYGCINVHASLLPKYRGAAPIQWAVINGEKVSGVTTMQMDEGLDTGDMLEKVEITLDKKETGGSLFDKLSAKGAALCVHTLAELEKGTITPQKQGESTTEYAKMLNKKSGEIDWEQILRMEGIYDVQVMRVSGKLTDHYDPANHVLRLSDSTYGSTSVAALGVAAHECGHAIQHAKHYVPLTIRGALVPVANFGSGISWPLIIMGLFIRGEMSTLFINLGILMFSLAVLFQIITLPVEFNASGRALKILKNSGMLYESEVREARSVLTAAALTYVASAASALLQLLRILILTGGRRNDDE